MTPEKLLQLTRKFLDGTLTSEEAKVLQAWWDRHGPAAIEVQMDRYASENEAGQLLLQRIKQTNAQGPSRAKIKKIYSRIAVAASILLFIGIGGWWYFSHERENKNPVIIADNHTITVVPGKNQATLTLSTGQIISLSATENEAAINDAGNSIINKDGEVIYKGSTSTNNSNHSVVYNTMQTPRGGQYQLRLPDGSQVWLNAGSKIKYPTVFHGAREVEVEGELYFNIQKDPKKPFIVKSTSQTVKVLGTEFNINAYNDDQKITTTLVSGSVQLINNNNNKILLQPGESGISGVKSENITLEKAMIDKVVAWKNGYFQFNNTGLEELMKQLSRWYDVDVKYVGKTPSITFNGGIKRNASFQSILSYLQAQGLSVKQSGKQLIISPK